MLSHLFLISIVFSDLLESWYFFFFSFFSSTLNLIFSCLFFNYRHLPLQLARLGRNSILLQKQSLFERLMGSMARTGSNKGSLSHPSHSHSHPNSNSGSTTLANHGSGGHHKEEKEAITVIDLVPGAPAPDRFAAVFASQPNSSR